MFQYSFFLISLLIGFTHTSSVYAPSMPTTSSPVFYYPIIHAFLFNAENGGHPLSCTFCTMLVNALEDYTQQHSLPIDQFILNDYCSLFGNSLQDVCRSTIKKTGPHLLAAMKKSTNPDHICKEIKLCTNPQCNLYPDTQRANITFSTQSQVSCGISLNSLHLSSLEASSNHSSTPTTSSSRDHKWRGKACDPVNTDLYPGRKHDPYPSLGLDHNCNGISGVDPSSGRTYEELFCENSKPLGVIVAGDSNGGNFQIPQRWVNASQWHGTPFGDLLDMVENTFNVPEASGLTGFCPDGSPKPCRSVYKYLYERNKCNFRDYQNIAVNGATVKNTLGYLQKLRRDKDLDHPILMFLKLTINDVCVPNMTTTEEFRSHLLEILAHLDAVLPSGSHLTAIGLIEDDIYERMKEKMHPSGVSNQDFYRFTACTGILPCRTLLNPDKELREARLQRVRELNQVYRLIFSEYKAKNFDLAFYDFPKQEIFKRLEEQKMDPTVMYDKMDAFHLSQTYDALLADYLWEVLMNDHPEWLGEVNPHNERIEKLFVHSEIDY